MSQEQSLRWSIEDALNDLYKLNELIVEELREYERCVDRFPQDLPRAATDLAESIQSYRRLTESLILDIAHYLDLTEGVSLASPEKIS
jgi:hypothetical protein